VAGSVMATPDAAFRLKQLQVNGLAATVFGYDDDNLPTSAGALTLAREKETGRLTGTTLGAGPHAVKDEWRYTGFGEVASYAARAGAAALYEVRYPERDGLGRITKKVETIGGVETTYEYAYWPAGWLKEVKVNGAVAATYTYDANGNRTGVTRAAGPSVDPADVAVDAQDRLIRYGDLDFAYTPAGELKSRTNRVTGATTTYDYDEFANLRKAVLPGGKTVEYLIDGKNRRVGKKVDGVPVQGFLYEGQLQVVAELDGANNVVSRFVYASKANVPDYMIKGATTYRIISDHLGSVRLVVNSQTGAVAQRLDYDEFGRVTREDGAGFQPFGFAGGLYDRDTKLVRFGARDYVAETGRWTAKDPIGVAGGLNIYAYVMNDPVNSIDPSGLVNLGFNLCDILVYLGGSLGEKLGVLLGGLIGASLGGGAGYIAGGLWALPGVVAGGIVGGAAGGFVGDLYGSRLAQYLCDRPGNPDVPCGDQLGQHPPPGEIPDWAHPPAPGDSHPGWNYPSAPLPPTQRPPGRRDRGGHPPPDSYNLG
jgi:RHS repeat-associated protein